jgi:uncharacterized SAM-binding protein YcdF (DUF218 family)
MWLNDMAGYLLVPPVNLLPVALIGLLLAWRGRRVGFVVAALALVCMVALSMPLVASALIWSLEADLPEGPVGAPPGAIVILSAESRRFLPGGVLAGDDVGPLTLERLRAGAVLHHRTGLPVLVTGGVVGPDQPPVARTMAMVLARDFGVQARWVEDRSRDTWENASLSAEILRRDGIGAISLVTSAWHMKRALASFVPTGLAVTPAPDALETREIHLPAMLAPNAGAWQRSTWALHEWIGLLVYRLRGSAFRSAPPG